MKRLRSNAGYTLVEIMVAMAVLGILAAMAVPMMESTTSGIKLRDQANAIADLVGLAKMRATSQFSRARIYADVKASTYVIQLQDAGTKAWTDEQSPVTLPFGVSFGWGDLEDPPPNTQDELKFAPACVDKDEKEIDGTACVMFNSRGIPINKDNSPTGGNAFYLTDGTGVRAVTITATPLVRRWWSSAGKANWVRQ
ncbi:MAG TPA: type II secretion system protein [Vicinamibacterales bacterium]|jgi:prepilin-type N-terminal cleavage/methylation domain-containing protein|nr:type II secretion system protein [Vicinamibacterales bacterium]